MSECPICDAELGNRIVDFCPDCESTFCVHCQITTPTAGHHRTCQSTRCPYRWKMICEDCLIAEPRNIWLSLSYGALAGLVIAIFHIVVQFQNLNATMISIDAAIVLIGALFSLLINRGDIQRCQCCRKQAAGVSTSTADQTFGDFE